jgi:hypothetical protein
MVRMTGDRGDRGAVGERGPKGDHGQGGSDGDEGPRGSRGSRGKDGGVVLFIVLAVFITGGWWGAEKHSCDRQAGVRAAARDVARTAAAARREDARNSDRRGEKAAAANYRAIALRYDHDARLAAPLDCSGVFPDTK